MSIEFGLQLWSVREDAARDLLETLGHVADIGYKKVEFAGFHGHPASRLRARLDELGLTCCGTHTPLEQFAPDAIEQTIADHKELGTDLAIIPWLPEERRNSQDAARATAAEFSAIAERLKGSGIRTGFHVHADDVRPLSGGPSAWDIFVRETPRDFILQWDTANGVEGGADAVSPLRQLVGRADTLHLKEHPWDGRVIGEGNIPWGEVFSAAADMGVQHYVVEQEVYGDRTPIEACKRCLEHLREMHIG